MIARPSIIALLAGLVFAAPRAAQAGDPVPGVTFDQALDLGAQTPAIKAARRALAARADGDRDIGGTLQATQLTVMPGAAVAPSDNRGLELQANLTQGWNLADLGGARRATARAERRTLTARVRARALAARLQAGRAWIDLRVLEQLEGLLAKSAALAQQRVATGERALAASVITAADLAEAQAAAAELAQEQIGLHGLRFETATELGRAMGLLPRAGTREASLQTRGPAPKPQLPDRAAVAARVADLRRLPEVAVQRLAETAARVREAEVSAQYAPVLGLGAQVERTAGGGAVVYGIASLGLQTFGQAARSLSQARAETAQRAGEASAEVLRARAQLILAVHDVEHARTRIKHIETQLLPALDDVCERRKRGLRAGTNTVFELQSAQRRALQGRMARVRARGAQTWAEVRLWLLLSALEPGSKERS